MIRDFDEQRAQEELQKGYKRAEKLLGNQDSIERFLQRLEKKLRVVPLVGDILASIPVLASLVRCYVKKDYTDIPIGSIIAIISALVYFLSPVDIIPDVIPGVGYIDDALVVTACLKLVESDVREYVAWRKANGKNTDV